MIYTVDANNNIIPQPLPRDKVAALIDQYPQILDSVKARNQSAYDTWGRSYGLIKDEPQPPRNIAGENYYQEALKSIDGQINALKSAGQSVPEDLIKQRDVLMQEYRKFVGLGESASDDKQNSIDAGLNLNEQKQKQ
jgi:hypothetical protein